MSNLSGITAALKRTPTVRATTADTSPAATPTGVPKKQKPLGKSADKATYGTLLTYVPHDVKRDAIRKWQDENPKQPDASDMVESLLRDFLKR